MKGIPLILSIVLCIFWIRHEVVMLARVAKLADKI